MAVDLLDFLILALAAVAAIHGYQRGAALQLASYTGLLLGLLLGALLAPRLAEPVSSPAGQAAVALGVLLLFTAVGDAAGWYVGSRIWAIARRSSFSAVDAVAGSIVAVIGMLLATWFIGLNLANGPSPVLSREIRQSYILRRLDGALPRPPSLLAQVRGFLNTFGFPEVFADLPPAPAGPVRGPTEGQTAEAAGFAQESTVRIVGQACEALQEGSGFVGSTNYVVTNAHVVAGMSNPQVQVQNGGSQSSTIVLFDPALDVAILRVEAPPGPPLPLDDDIQERGEPGAVLGYPGGGGLTIRPAAIRRGLHPPGRDIYGSSIVFRDVYELQVEVRPGNSGGPFVLTDGEVAGMVFAASTTDAHVGYALTSREVLPLLRQAEGRTQPVSSGDCVR